MCGKQGRRIVCFRQCGESLYIRLYTSRSTWNPAQREMMQRARRVHGLRLMIVMILIVVAGLAGQQIGAKIQEDRDQIAAQGIVDGLMTADVSQVSSFRPVCKVTTP